MIPEIKVSLKFRGSVISSPQPTPVGSTAGELTSALQIAAQRTNDLLTNLIDSGKLSEYTGAAVGVEEDEESGDDDDDEGNLSDSLPQPKKKRL